MARWQLPQGPAGNDSSSCSQLACIPIFSCIYQLTLGWGSQAAFFQCECLFVLHEAAGLTKTKLQFMANSQAPGQARDPSSVVIWDPGHCFTNSLCLCSGIIGADQQICHPSHQSTKVSIRLFSEPGKEVGLLFPLLYKNRKPQTFLSPDGPAGR